ncbi:hypothetical protein IFM89_019205 [Coptis chinensis]|uniref:Uncharacterized protein n=1 Tax=Coptis chinensis TaxID=261450 RepID=A0A835M305_9MAGN|nr:hypothetical protein IFM89_019205 [Coptis chinensis]
MDNYNNPWSSIPSSSSQQQGSRNQMEMTASSFIYPYGRHVFSSMDSGIVREPVDFKTSNLRSCESGKSELGSSFFSLLSRPSSQLQSGTQPMPSSASSMASAKLPMQNSNVSPVGFPSPQQGNHQIGTGSDHYLGVPSRAASTTIFNRSPDLQGSYQMANLIRSSETDQTVGRNIQASSNEPICTISAASDQASTFTKGRVLVFCLATNGELLLNNIGLLGVVCLCHGLQMSVSKFCEHSGSCIVNPGDAVRLKSGETIAQWRRIYFPKYGIRVPDDNNGWEWPEKIPATVGLVNYEATLPNISKNSDMFKVVDPFILSERPGHHWNTIVSADSSHMGESVNRKTFRDVVHDAQQRNFQDGCNIPLKMLAGPAQVFLPTPADNQTMYMVKEGQISSGLVLSSSLLEKGREDSGYQSISDYIGVLSKSGDPLIANQSLENFRFLGTSSDVNRGKGPREAFIVERDNTSSNIELRLGQPSQQSYNVEGSVVSTLQPQPLSTLQAQPFVMYSNSPKPLLQDPVFHNVGSPMLKEESRQNLGGLLPSNTSISHRGIQSKSNVRHLAPRDSAKVEKLKGDMVKRSHTYLPQFSTLPERDVLSQTSKNRINYSETFMFRAPHGVYSGTNGPSEYCSNRKDGTEEKQLNNIILGHFNHADRCKRVQDTADNCYYGTERGNFLFNNNQMAGPSPSIGFTSDSRLSSASTVKGKQSSYWCHSAAILHDASDLRHSHGKTSFLQNNNHFDHGLLRSFNSSTLTAAPGLPLSEASTGFTSTNSVGRPSLTHMLSNNESVDISPHFLDENLRLLALRYALDPSKQKHPITSAEMEQQQGRLYSLSTELQQRGTTLGSLAAEEPKEGPYNNINNGALEIAVKPLQTCSNHYVDGNYEKLGGVTGTKNWCNFSTPSRGISVEPDVAYPLSHEPLTDKQSLASFGRTENNIMISGEHDVCGQREPSSFFPGKCSSAVHSISFEGNRVSRSVAPDDTSRTHFGGVTGKASKTVPSIFDNGHLVQEDKSSMLNQSENLNRKIPVQNGCHTSQWRDVPSKHIRVGSCTNVEKPTKVLDASNVNVQVVEIAVKRFDGTHKAESLKEQQMSNAYSSCSAPAVTEITVEVNTAGSCTIDAGTDRFVNDHVVDEGSGIERCWSTDDELDSERSTETISACHTLHLSKGGRSSSCLPIRSSHCLVDNHRLQSPFGRKKVQKRLPTGDLGYESILEVQPLGSILRTEKRKRTMKWKRIDVSCPVSGLSSVQYDSPIGDTDSHSCSSRGTQTPSKPKHGVQRACGVPFNQPSGLKRRYSALSSAKTLSQNRDLCELANHHREWEDDSQTLLKDHMNHHKIFKLSNGKNLKRRWTPDVSRECSSEGLNQGDTGEEAKYISTVGTKDFSSNWADTFGKKAKPVKARRCSTNEADEPEFISTIDTKETCFRKNSESYGKLSVLEDEGTDSDYYNNVMKNVAETGSSTFEKKAACFSEDDLRVEELPTLGKGKNYTSNEMLKCSNFCPGAPLKSRFKEARKRSLYELAGKGMHLRSSDYPTKAPSSLQSKFRSQGKPCLKKGVGSKCQKSELSLSRIKRSLKEPKIQPFILDLDAFCSVCGDSKKDVNNGLLECSSCVIRVHQACYGVSRVPKGRWCCRPCRSNSKDIVRVCVLCGYEGGAMTQALKSRNIVKGLLKSWSFPSESKSLKFSPLSENSKNDLRLLDTSGSGHEVDSIAVTRSGTELSPTAVLVRVSHDKEDVIQNSNDLDAKLQVQNSVTAGIVDPTIKQWVHMVCGLWTPGTRCPNVDTMSAFDVSGVSHTPKNLVCSLCNRPGGSCIECRVVNCSVHFHPWCARQKGLLQSEVEGVDNDKVGFYGRCVLHATHHASDSVDHPMDINFDTPGREEFTCARTEGYKGRKKDGFSHNLQERSNGNGECLVPQEQIDAWLHINGHKSCTVSVVKTQTSEVEYDYRKEYARYKQAKGWKNLVVYKSGIHALGLYTSQFISRGAMVVEYIGEIVGLRVADKREIEYQSGRKLQYKGACYFFRIDKEHIIDATHKGGIARFVNHSCLVIVLSPVTKIPNCVAKVISVRNEKKVVFFAERDIFPGEEITYDYHFNHEDEGDKIPCLCNSRKCRRYLN